MKEDKLTQLQDEIGYHFQNLSLLNNALTHSSYANERHWKYERNNERLEFLGDAVLELVSSDYIFSNHKDMVEGKMTKLRASLVCEMSLASSAREIKLGEYLKLGHGEWVTGGGKRDSILSDAFEAVIGAIYLDGTRQESLFCSMFYRTSKRNSCFMTVRQFCRKLSRANFTKKQIFLMHLKKRKAPTTINRLKWSAW
mgnify:CR=1 FL=1